MFSAIFFDLDGTLLDSSHVWDKATRRAITECNIDFSEEDFISLAGVLVHDLLAQKGYDEAMVKKVRTLRDIYMKDEVKHSIRWMDGAEELLQSLDGLTTGIVTSVHQNMFTLFDDALSIARHMNTVIVADDVQPHYKPHPKGLLLACERLGVELSECIYVGDQECDLLAAGAAGMDFILMRGPRTPESLLHDQAVFRLCEITALLGKN